WLGHWRSPVMPLACSPHAGALAQLGGPFSDILDAHVHDPFIRNWLDLLCFLLSGLPARGTSAAEMAFMFADWYQPGVVLDYPQGGGGAIIAALIRGIEKHGGEVRCNAHIESVLLESGRAAGLRLRGGEVVRSRQAIVSNASAWDTVKLIPDPQLQKKFTRPPACDSFLHLHLGFDATGLDHLACHHLMLDDWQRGLTAPQNAVLVSIPSVLDPSLAPPGQHALHAYTPATEPYAIWAGLDRRSPEYQARKQERLEPVWQALERAIPDLRSRCQLILAGTPLTHARFLRRDRGSYGPAISASDGLFPGARSPVPGLLCCGDATFPGIGVPAVAASGMLAANTLVSVFEQWRMLEHLESLPPYDNNARVTADQQPPSAGETAA
ncbi:MAG: carotene isomerase, partial [Spirulinaceae cyanobacterium RM2_2_10]|nr:carotene isomerase [Spirulinaceae cyanobacterium RM2_2_10]